MLTREVVIPDFFRREADQFHEASDDKKKTLFDEIKMFT